MNRGRLLSTKTGALIERCRDKLPFMGVAGSDEHGRGKIHLTFAAGRTYILLEVEMQQSLKIGIAQSCLGQEVSHSRTWLHVPFSSREPR